MKKISANFVLNNEILKPFLVKKGNDAHSHPSTQHCNIKILDSCNKARQGSDTKITKK